MSNDPVLEKAMESLRRATEEVREWEAFIAKYRKLTSGECAPAAEPSDHATTATEQSAATKPWPTDKILLAAGEVLSQHGPMHLAQLYEALLARGAVLGGKNPRNNLCAKLSADKARFTSHKTAGWWFTGERLPGESRTARGRLPSDENEEGSDSCGTEPLHMNGATSTYSQAASEEL